jgi:hypothetical protein
LSDRLSYFLVVLVLLGAAVWRIDNLTGLPPGLHPDEVTEIRLIETARRGRIEVFYDISGIGYEGLYPAINAAVTSALGGGVIGYRIVGVLAGFLSISLLYAVGKRLFGALAGLMAAALMSLSLFPALLARSISPESFVPLFITALLLAITRSFPVYGLRTRHEPKTVAFAALGALLGLGFYLHPAAYPAALMALSFVVVIVLARGLPGRRPLSRRTLSFTWFALVILIVIATPYLIAVLGSPTLGGGRWVFDGGWTLDSILRGLSGLVFVGDSNVAYNLPARPMFDLISGVFILIGLAAAARFWRQPRFLLALLAFAALLPVALVTPDSPDFARFAAVLPVLALLFGLGVTTLINSLPARVRLPVGLFGLVGLLGFNLIWTGRDLFTVYPADPLVREVHNARIGEIARYLDRTVEHIPTVMCVRRLAAPGGLEPLTEAQRIALMIHRSPNFLRYADCGITLVLPEGGERGQLILLEAGGLERVTPFARAWVEGGDFVPLSDDVTDAVIRLDTAEALAARIGALTTTAPVGFAPEAPGESPIAAPPLRLGENVTFLGYDRSWGETHRAGDVVPVVTYWRIDGVIPPDLTFFTHVLADPAAAPAAQSDTIGVLAATLRPRDVVVHTAYIQLPWTIGGGRYLVSTGAYRAEDRRRLEVFEGDPPIPRGTRLFIGDFLIE